MTGNTRVVVVGGGYAGVMAANRLTRRGDVTVTLINSRPAFVERIRLHQMVAGNYDASADYARLLAKGVDLVVDTVTGIDAGDRVVTLAGGGTARYDYLIYAVGSVGAAPGDAATLARYPAGRRCANRVKASVVWCSGRASSRRRLRLAPSRNGVMRHPGETRSDVISRTGHG